VRYKRRSIYFEYHAKLCWMLEELVHVGGPVSRWNIEDSDVC
jgi:hypothetical protein